MPQMWLQARWGARLLPHARNAACRAFLGCKHARNSLTVDAKCHGDRLSNKMARRMQFASLTAYMQLAPLSHGKGLPGLEAVSTHSCHTIKHSFREFVLAGSAS